MRELFYYVSERKEKKNKSRCSNKTNEQEKINCFGIVEQEIRNNSSHHSY